MNDKWTNAMLYLRMIGHVDCKFLAANFTVDFESACL